MSIGTNLKKYAVMSMPTLKAHVENRLIRINAKLHLIDVAIVSELFRDGVVLETF